MGFNFCLHHSSNQQNPSRNSQLYIGMSSGICQRFVAVESMLILSFIFGVLGGGMFLINGMQRQAARRVKMPAAVTQLFFVVIFMIIAVAVGVDSRSSVESNFEDQIEILEGRFGGAATLKVDTSVGRSISFLAVSFAFFVVSWLLGLFYVRARSDGKASWK